MQAYGKGFAQIYNTKWAGFANQVAPAIMNFYASTPLGQKNKTVLDLCCGAGHLAKHFLEDGYRFVGVDLSEEMLKYARENAGRYLKSGQAKFLKADAGDFELDERFGLVVSTFDSLNHLENEQALENCFRCVYNVCEGYFIFDLNTRKGLRNWNSIQVQDTHDDSVIITRGIYDGEGNKAWMKITGFAGLRNGLYERFDETVYNTVFEMARVKKTLLDIGWKKVHFARVKELSTPIKQPEEEPRIFIVACK